MINGDAGLFETISYEYLKNKCKMFLRMKDTTSEDAFILDAIDESVRGLKNCYTLIPAVANLPIDQTTLSAKLPSGFRKLRGQDPIQVYDGTLARSTPENAVNNITYSPLPVRNGFFKGDLNDTFMAQVVDGYIYFGSMVTQEYCQISYLSTNIDSTGEFKVPVDAETVIKYGVAGQYYMSIGDINRGEFFRVKYANGVRYLKGLFADPDSLELQAMSNTNNKFATGGNGWGG